jgi:hypothetical protein
MTTLLWRLSRSCRCLLSHRTSHSTWRGEGSRRHHFEYNFPFSQEDVICCAWRCDAASWHTSGTLQYHCVPERKFGFLLPLFISVPPFHTFSLSSLCFFLPDPLPSFPYFLFTLFTLSSLEQYHAKWLILHNIHGICRDFSLCPRVQTDSGIRSISYLMGTRGPFSGVEWPEREADHPHSSSAETKNAWSYTFTKEHITFGCGR